MLSPDNDLILSGRVLSMSTPSLSRNDSPHIDSVGQAATVRARWPHIGPRSLQPPHQSQAKLCTSEIAAAPQFASRYLCFHIAKALIGVSHIVPDNAHDLRIRLAALVDFEGSQQTPPERSPSSLYKPNLISSLRHLSNVHAKRRIR